jgi:hypothetical protein
MYAIHSPKNILIEIIFSGALKIYNFPVTLCKLQEAITLHL